MWYGRWLTPNRVRRRGRKGFVNVRMVGGLLAHWAYWTRSAASLAHRAGMLARRHGPVPVALLRLGAQTTDANGAIFDAANQFRGCIPGIHEVLRGRDCYGGGGAWMRGRISRRDSWVRSAGCSRPTLTVPTMDLCGPTSIDGWLEWSDAPPSVSAGGRPRARAAPRDDWRGCRWWGTGRSPPA